MKRFYYYITLVFCAISMVAFAACTESTEDPDETAGSKEPVVSNGKIAVVYYSASGNTKRVAEYIAGASGGTLFEIEPVEPYTSADLDYNNPESHVSREHNDESLRNVELTKNTPENWNNYDTVFVGYPIWWGIAAWPINNFVKESDFSGKTVIPFCTSSSSPMGRSGELLKDLAEGKGTWHAGRRFSSGASQSDVTDWVKQILTVEE